MPLNASRPLWPTRLTDSADADVRMRSVTGAAGWGPYCREGGFCRGVPRPAAEPLVQMPIGLSLLKLINFPSRHDPLAGLEGMGGALAGVT